jgi:peroxiredoxin
MMKTWLIAKKKIFIPLFIFLLLSILLWQLQQKPLAPAVKFTTIQQQQISLEQLRGHMVMVNFWATTCSGCVAEMPQLIQTWQQYHDQGFEVVAIAMQYDDIQQIKNFTAERHLPFWVVHDEDGTLSQAFGGVTLTPTAFIVDPQGHVMSKTIGDFDFNRLQQQIKQYLKLA